MKKDIARKILFETEDGYDLISDKFSQTRKHFWRELEFIKDYANKGDKILDFGCGNGRLYDFLKDKNIQYWGMDVSERLIGIAKKEYPEQDVSFSKLDAGQTSLPFEEDFFNACYSIAVFHHIPSKEFRKKMADEIFRTTKSSGRVIITVWNLWQPKYVRKVLENWKNKILRKSNLDWNDCYISFTNNKGDIFQRYHHAFTKKELKKLFEKAGFKAEMCEVVGGRNIVFIGNKRL